jgi:anti-sigma regulatory factor (Ser/Thr protein kinase)
VQLARDPAVVASARQHAVDLCRGVLDESRCDDLALAVSELVTNAIRYGGEPLTLDVQTRPDGVRVEVTDGDPTPITVATPDELDTGRRGLVLVAALCARWGWEPLAHGKRVWCEV